MSPTSRNRRSSDPGYEQGSGGGDGWRIDKHIPLALIVTILGQGAGVVWWGSQVQQQVADHERRLVTQESAKVGERIAVIEAQMKDSKELQLEMNRKLDRIMSGDRGIQR